LKKRGEGFTQNTAKKHICRLIKGLVAICVTGRGRLGERVQRVPSKKGKQGKSAGTFRARLLSQDQSKHLSSRNGSVKERVVTGSGTGTRSPPPKYSEPLILLKGPFQFSREEVKKREGIGREGGGEAARPLNLKKKGKRRAAGGVSLAGVGRAILSNGQKSSSDKTGQEAKDCQGGGLGDASMRVKRTCFELKRIIKGCLPEGKWEKTSSWDLYGGREKRGPPPQNGLELGGNERA